MIGLIESTAGSRRCPNFVDLIDRIFKRGGYLETVLKLDHRPQQYEMAMSVATSIDSDSPLLFEAGTGVGKSLAYLIPGIIRSIITERPFVVSSHTITLQEQLQKKDTLICRKLFEQVDELKRFSNFRAVVMLGKANYCCTTRLNNAIRDAQSSKQKDLFSDGEVADLSRIAKWSATAKAGTIQELSPTPAASVWETVNADSSTCSKKNCDPDTCFYQRAKKQLTHANCIILNHSLLFSLINAGMQPEGDAKGILFSEDLVVLDEAHRVPAIATDHFGTHVSSFAIDRALKRIYNPNTKRGILGKIGGHWEKATIEEALLANVEFFGYLQDAFLSKVTIRRLYDPQFCENILAPPLKKVAEYLGSLIQKIDDERLQDELRDHRRRLMGYRDAVTEFIEFGEEDHVRWLELSGKKNAIVTLRSSPLDVAPYLRKHIFMRGVHATMTSATLSDGTSMERFRTQVGGEIAEAEMVDSPFDYETNCRIYLATDSPQPDRGQGRLDLDYLANMICWFSRRVTGGTLVLFTSHTDLQKTYQRCEAFFKKLGRPLYAQGMGAARSELTKQFADSGEGILFGTDSFWTGIDVPGPSLSQVIITRLPFENPNHPVSEARSEYISQRGGYPFVEMVVPEAVTKFRQGVGRLIRHMNDRGNVVVLDSRIVNQPYGSSFTEALPVKTFVRFDRHNRSERFLYFDDF